MLSSELEFCLNEAFQRARDQRHEFMTVEHLLLALLDIPRVHEILKACNSNITELRRQLTEFIEEQTPLLAQDDDTDLKARFAAVATKLADAEQAIADELIAAQGSPVEIGGYYLPDDAVTEKAMRPSATFNAIIDGL